MKKDNSKFQALLDEHHIWPEDYVFKFVVPAEKVTQVTDLLADERIVLKPSSKGNYISVTLEAKMHSSQEVLNIYEKVSSIEGIIAL